MTEPAAPTSPLRGRAVALLASGLRLYATHVPFRRGAGAFTRLIRSALNRGWPAPVIPLDSGLVMALEPSTVGFTCLEKGVWEPAQTAIILDLIGPGAVALNVGANVGYYAITMGSRVGPEGHVHAFEIQPRMIDALRRNVALNELADRVTVVEQGCFSAEGEATIDFHDDPGSTRIAFESVGTRVTLTTVDRYATENALERLDFVLIDTEGADLEVIRGGTETIRRFRPVVMAETNLLDAFGGTEAELIELMSDLGYQMEAIENAHSKDIVFRPRPA